jgi:hypothetical protein
MSNIPKEAQEKIREKACDIYDNIRYLNSNDLEGIGEYGYNLARAEIEAIKKEYQHFKDAMARGENLYAHLKVDEDRTPFQKLQAENARLIGLLEEQVKLTYWYENSERVTTDEEEMKAWQQYMTQNGLSEQK